MLLNILYLVTSILGLIVVLVTLVYRNNRYVNTYLSIYFLLGSLRFLTYALTNILDLERFPTVDYAFTTLAWPLLFLYFKDLTKNSDSLQIKSDIKHLALPVGLFILICFENQIKEDVVLVLMKIGVPIVVFYTLGYCLWSFILLKKHLWTKRSIHKSTNKQQVAIRNWSKFLYFTFTLILIRFLANPIINPHKSFFNTINDFLYLGSILWIVVYIKLLTSPEFLFGYEVFQDKINKHKIDFIVFDNQWNKAISFEITNKKDLILKEILNRKYINYLESIENVSQNTNLFFKQGFKLEDLANKLKIPKSHVVFLFKYYSKISFNEYKSNIRVKKAIQLIQDGYTVSNTMESLAIEVGFSTYSSFFKNFKVTTGISPLDYYQKIKQN